MSDSDLKPFEPVRERLGRVDVWSASVSEMDNIAYLIVDRPTGAAVLVDAADEIDRLTALVRDAEQNRDDDVEAAKQGRIRVERIITTHRHADHWQALNDARSTFDVPSLAGEFDAQAIRATTDGTLSHGEFVEIGGVRAEVILLRGHTPGSIALAIEQPDAPAILITGDSLFPGGPGSTNSPEEFTSLMNDLEERIFGRFDDDALVLPGHGERTTLGDERPHLQEWRERGW